MVLLTSLGLICPATVRRATYGIQIVIQSHNTLLHPAPAHPALEEQPASQGHHQGRRFENRPKLKLNNHTLSRYVQAWKAIRTTCGKDVCGSGLHTADPT